MAEGPERKDWAMLIERVAECEDRLDTLDRRLAKWAKKVKLED